MEVKGKRISVIGLGVSGKAASMLLKQMGACVFAMDSNDSAQLRETAAGLIAAGIDTRLGLDGTDLIEGSDIIVVSPGVPDTAPALVNAGRRSIPVVSEIEAASWFLPNDIIAVTGTNGKSTIASLIDMMLKESGRQSILCGNIGKAFSSVVLSSNPGQNIVLEVSSFQLKHVDSFRPKIALISNVTQNHLDVHPDFNDYFCSKKNIYKNQTQSDFFVLNSDDDRLARLRPAPGSKIYCFSVKKEVRGFYLKDNNFIINMSGENRILCSSDNVLLSGAHNYYNILASCCCAYLAGATPDGMLKALMNFKGLAHRCEQVAVLGGVRYIDDSKSTSVDSCAAALKAFRGKVVLIAGGRDKGSDFTVIGSLVRDRARVVIVIGEAGGKIKHDLSALVPVRQASGMEEAVKIAREEAVPGDFVLLSPMCASFDMYKSYAARGEDFKNHVLNIRKGGGKGETLS
ncbi:MAG: UDP-N-acetylmuramoyl-L-alanine--D-glutamate ligase [Candidatus Omnitrophica bacterium]|nr:UDP-N-acetylmuramoyl-L-alanine--D-glutamate ligase [Candidatus Omnitrophota bacterium]